MQKKGRQRIGTPEAVRMFRGMAHALHRFHRRCNIVHADIKPENILVERKTTGTYNFFLSDYGDAKQQVHSLMVDKKSENYPLNSVATTGYFTLTDTQVLHKASKNMDLEQYTYFQIKRDTFAMALTIWFVVTGDAAYPLQGVYADTNQLFNKKKFRKKLGRDMTDIILSAMSEDPSDRPSSEKILSVTDTTIQNISKKKKCR